MDLCRPLLEHVKCHFVCNLGEKMYVYLIVRQSIMFRPFNIGTYTSRSNCNELQIILVKIGCVARHQRAR